MGKTRLALESARRYAEAHRDAEVWCVLHRGADLFNDLRARFQAPGHYLLVLDDANRLTRFEYALELLRDARPDRTVKLLATVRDYAATPVEDAARAFGAGTPVVVEPLSNDEIRTLVQEEFGILNHAYSERIADVARGNPRLAVMAARVALREESLASLRDVTALYDEYFRTVRQDVADVQDPTLLQAAAAVALLRVVDRTNEEQMALVTALAGLEPDVFWRGVQRLHALEVLDLYEDEVVRVADQVLATYLLYQAVFVRRVVDFGAVLVRMVPMPRLRARLVDATNPIVSAFERDAVLGGLRTAVAAARRTFEAAEDADAALHLLDLFWFVTPAEALVAAHDAVMALSPDTASAPPAPYKESGDAVPSASALSLLSHFGQGDEHEVEAAVELLAEYAERRPAEAPLVLRVLDDAFGVDHRSYLHGFEREQWTARVLRGRAEVFADRPAAHAAGLYLSYAKSQLRTHFHRLESAGGGAFRMFNFHVPATEEVAALRGALWAGVLALHAVPTCREAAFAVLQGSIGSGLDLASRDVVATDASVLLPWVRAYLDPADGAACTLVHDLLAALRRLGVSYDDAIAGHFTTAPSAPADLLTTDLRDRENLDWDVFEAQRQARITAYAGSLTESAQGGADTASPLECPASGVLDDEHVVEHLHAFARAAAALRSARGGDAKAYEFDEAVRSVLRTVEGKAPCAYATFLVEHLRAGNALALTPLQLAGGARRRPRGGRGLRGPQRRRVSGLGALAMRPLRRGTRRGGHARAARRTPRAVSFGPADVAHGRSDVPRALPSSDPGLLTDVVRILIGRQSEGPAATRILTSLVRFGAGETVFVPLIEDERPLAEAVYLAVAEADAHADYKGALFDVLLNADPTFAGRWAAARLTGADVTGRGHDGRDYTFLWRRADHAAVATQMADVIRADATPRYGLWEPPGEVFTLRAEAPDADALRLRQDAVLDAWIAAGAKDRDAMARVFGVVSNHTPERRRDRVATFFAHNTGPEDFAALQLEPAMRGWSGSAVPLYQRDLEFYESLLPLCRGVAFLRQRERLERQIAGLREEIEREKRRDFADDRF